MSNLGLGFYQTSDHGYGGDAKHNYGKEEARVCESRGSQAWNKWT